MASFPESSPASSRAPKQDELEFHPQSLRVQFDDLVVTARAQRELFLHAPGSIVERPRGERAYWYWRYYALDGKEQEQSLGAVDDEQAAARKRELESRIAAAHQLARESNVLRRFGYCSADNSASVTLAVLYNAGVFATGAMLVGTHAYGAILNTLGIKPRRNYATEDIDVARYARIELATIPYGGILEVLQRTGLRFVEVPELDSRRPSTSFVRRGTHLKVDLLVPSMDYTYRSVRVPELKAHATALPHLRFLLQEQLDSAVLSRDRVIPLKVPRPERYCIHKLVVSQLRVKTSAAKDEKDLDQAVLLAQVLEERFPGLIEETAGLLGQRARKLAAKGARVAAPRTGYEPARTVLSKLAGGAAA
jgi:hypothetical protein